MKRSFLQELQPAYLVGISGSDNENIWASCIFTYNDSAVVAQLDTMNLLIELRTSTQQLLAITETSMVL